MKNWLCYVVGDWQWDPDAQIQAAPQAITSTGISVGIPPPSQGTYKWVEGGFSYIDPEKIHAVTEYQGGTPCTVISIAGAGDLRTRKTAKEIVGDIQSALAD